MRTGTAWVAVAGLAAAAGLAQKPEDDIILKAMREEMARAKQLKLGGAADAAYYFEYALDDLESISASASQGALLQSNRSHARVPRVQVRVGTAEFDNTNYIFTDLFGSPRGGGGVSLDNDLGAIRHYFWLATDRVFKGSVEAIARKRAALKNVTQQEKLNDFAKAEPTQLYEAPSKVSDRGDDWKKLAREASGAMTAFPKVTSSQVDVDGNFGTSYYLNSEGTETRFADDAFFIRVRASAQAADGMVVRDAAVLQARTLDRMAGVAEAKAAATEVGRNVTALLEAPAGEDYTGPVLVEGVASGQLFAQLLASNLSMTRSPVSEPGRPAQMPQSEFEGRKGSRVLPEFFDVIDDPTQDTWNGHQLLGSYPVDMEGVKAKPLTVIEAGTLQNFLLTRLPVRGFEGSNGRARLPGPFGSKAAVFSNLFVKAKQSVAEDELRKKFMDAVTQRGKPYGIIVKKLDYPASGSLDELRRQTMASGQRGGSTRPSALPTLIYRVYADGKQELVRGLRFRGLTARTLRDITAASSTEQIFQFIGNGSPLPVMGQGGYITLHSLVSPSAILFDELELEKRQEDWPKLPVVPPPPMVSAR